jgi:hypothetical protein
VAFDFDSQNNLGYFSTMNVNSQSPMREVSEVFPGAQRALFRRYHIGGCNCGGILFDRRGHLI